jgi:hypothetical protein
MDNDAALVNDGRAQRPITPTDLRHKPRLVAVAPERLASGRIEAVELFSVAHAMKQVDASGDDRHTGDPGPDLPPPEPPRPGGGPGVGKVLIGGGHAISPRPQNLGPIARSGQRRRAPHRHDEPEEVHWSRFRCR